MAKLKIENANIIFANLIDEGFGKGLVIEATQEIGKQISDFWKENKIGKDPEQIGNPVFKEYEGKWQFTVKITDNTRFAGINGLSKDDLGFGAVVDIIISSFEYNNKFTKGQTRVGANASAVAIKQGRKVSGDADLEELMEGLS